MNNQSVFFRKMTEQEEFDWMGCEIEPIIAELNDVEIKHLGTFNIKIVIDTWNDLEGNECERLGVYCYAPNFKNNWMFMYNGDPVTGDRSYFFKLINNIFRRDEITVPLFLANDFSQQEI